MILEALFVYTELEGLKPVYIFGVVNFYNSKHLVIFSVKCYFKESFSGMYMLFNTE